MGMQLSLLYRSCSSFMKCWRGPQAKTLLALHKCWCGLQPQLALALSGIFSNFRGPCSAEPAVSRERKFNLSIQPALAYEDVSMLESSAKLRMAAKQ